MSFPRFDSDFFIAIKMSSHQTSAKPRSSKCCHFCFPFDSHNYCPTCRESGKGDDICVTNQSPCNISISVLVSPRNSKSKSNIDVCLLENRRHRILILAKMILIYWVTMVMPFLALKQTLRVLLTICFLHLPVPKPYILNLYH